MSLLILGGVTADVSSTGRNTSPLLLYANSLRFIPWINNIPEWSYRERIRLPYEVAAGYPIRYPWRMAVNLDSIVSVGGMKLVDLLNYAVRAVEADFLFTFLVGEYRQAPTAQKAVALYDCFCAPQALARVSASGSIPAVNPR